MSQTTYENIRFKLVFKIYSASLYRVLCPVLSFLETTV